jgi:GAF domain-containing protein
MLSRGHKLAVGGVSMIGWSTATQKSRIALDVGKDAIRFSNPLLPDTRSELAIPIVSRNITVGALSLQSDREAAFSDNDIIAFQGIADSLAVALENATLFQNARENLDEIRSLNRIYVQRSWGSEVIIPGALEYTYEEKSSKRSKHKTTMLEIPLLLRDQPVGGLSLEIPEGTLTPDDRAIIMAIADQTAQALENVRLLQETQERALREEKINELVMKFSGAGSIDEIMKLAAQEIGTLSSISEVNVHLIPELSSQEGDHFEDASSSLETTE